MREKHTFDNLDFLFAVYQTYWELARAAKPGLTQYQDPNPRPEEREIFFAGAPLLDLVGFRTKERMVEYTCHTEPNQHIQGWEIYELRQWLKKRTLEDGTPIQGIRVVFPNREMANREKRPLLDIGAQVRYYNRIGDTEEITE